MAHDVFISYSSKDKASADAACAVLEGQGIRCWMAPRDIQPGADWSTSIVRAIAAARVFVLVFSAHANASPQIKREVERAVNRGIPLIPFRIEDVQPAEALEYFINTPHWLDAFTPPIERHLNYLASVTKHILDGVPPPAPESAKAAPRRSWMASLGFEFPGGRFGITLSIVSAVLIAVVAPALYLNMTAWQRSASAPGSVSTSLPSQPGTEQTAAPPPPPTGSPSPSGPGEVRLDFAAIDTMSAPGRTVAADPYLHAEPIRITVTQREPAGSVIVFVNNTALYSGQALAPTVSQNFLTQQGTANQPASFTLSFAEPVERATFMIPKVYPATPSGVTFPAWRAVALGADGEELSSVSEKLLRRFADFPAQTYTLNAPGLEGMAAIKFYSDPRLNGVPFAGFSTVLIEALTLTRLQASR